VPPRPVPLPERISQAEAEAHAAFVAELGDKALWTTG
jgi:DNA polymerase-3 subunit epsilon